MASHGAAPSGERRDVRRRALAAPGVVVDLVRRHVVLVDDGPAGPSDELEAARREGRRLLGAQRVVWPNIGAQEPGGFDPDDRRVGERESGTREGGTLDRKER